MKKIMKLIGLTAVTVFAFAGCGMGTSPTKSAVMEDEALTQEMHAEAEGILKNYFDVDINDGIERDVEAIQTEVLVDKETKAYEPLSNILQATGKKDPQEGELYSYGVVFSPDRTKVTGAIIGHFSEAKNNKYEDEVLQETAMNFIVEKELVANPEALVFEKVDDSVKKQNFVLVVYKNGEDRLAVGVSTQTGEVMYFEHLPQIPQA